MYSTWYDRIYGRGGRRRPINQQAALGGVKSVVLSRLLIIMMGSHRRANGGESVRWHERLACPWSLAMPRMLQQVEFNVLSDSMCTYDHIRWYIIHIGLYSYIANIAANILLIYRRGISRRCRCAHAGRHAGDADHCSGRGRRQSSWRARSKGERI